MQTSVIAPPAADARARVLSRDADNQTLFERYAKPGVVGLAGGVDLIDRTIRKAQRNFRKSEPRSLFSHAFICVGKRFDDQHWVIESDLDWDLGAKQIRLGVQENRAKKYFDAKTYPNLALLDFQLEQSQSTQLLSEALNLLAGQTSYSLREILGTLLALQKSSLRSRRNLLAQDGALFCSAMVQHCFSAIDLDFQPQVSTKNTNPEDIARTALAHQRYEVIRAPHH